MAMLYFHVPFCGSKCAYCAFYSVADRSRADEVVEAMEAELESRRDFLGGVPLRTIYFGGGTPSVLSIEQLGRLVGAAERVFVASRVEERTLEANPEQLSTEYLQGLRRLGFDRLSIGLQSFSDERLKQMRRRHTAREAVEAVGRARAAGFANISIDLIYGFEDMSDDEWQASVHGAVELGAEHISAYHLSVEPGTLFARRGVRAADDERSVGQYEFLCRELAAAGYEHYEISNWAKPGRHSRHNSGYWTGEAYLGVGPSAHSYDGDRERSWNTGVLVGYERQREELTEADVHNEWMMLRLRTSAGIDPQAYRERFGRALPQTSWLTRTAAGGYRISEKDWLVSDGLIAELFI